MINDDIMAWGQQNRSAVEDLAYGVTSGNLKIGKIVLTPDIAEELNDLLQAQESAVGAEEFREEPSEQLVEWWIENLHAQTQAGEQSEPEPRERTGKRSRSRNVELPRVPEHLRRNVFQMTAVALRQSDKLALLKPEFAQLRDNCAGEEPPLGNMLQCQAIWDAHEKGVGCIAISPDSKLLASASGLENGSAAPDVAIWGLPDGDLLAELTGHSGMVSCMVFDPDSKTLVTGSFDESIRVWSLPEGRLVTVFESDISKDRYLGPVSCLSLTPNGKILASGHLYYGDVQLWSLPDRQYLGALAADQGSNVSCIEIDSRSELLIYGYDDSTDGTTGAIQIWSLPERRLVRSLLTDNQRVASLAVSPDGYYLASGLYGGSVNLWELPTGQLVGESKTKVAFPKAIFSLDGRILVTAGTSLGPDADQFYGDSPVQLWHVPSMQLHATLTGHRNGVTCLALSLDGRILFTGGESGILRLWGLSEEKWRDAFYGHTSLMNCLAASPDGRMIVTGGKDGKLIVWTSEICRLSQTPIYQTSAGDLAWVQEVLTDRRATSGERGWLRLLEALMSARQDAGIAYRAQQMREEDSGDDGFDALRFDLGGDWNEDMIDDYSGRD
jgi:WD40 repeat protein